MAHQSNEVLRKLLHIGFGLCVFALRWLTWWQAAIVALIAILNNRLVLHRVFGRRVSRHEQGYDAGIMLYPTVVLLLLVIFRHDLVIAGTTWAILAFGDGFATLAGKTIRGPRLPWNRDKSWSGFIAFIAFGFVGALAAWMFLNAETRWLPAAVIVGLAVVVAAIVESLALPIDDNISVPLVSALVLVSAAHVTMLPDLDVSRTALAWIGANTLLAIVGFAAKSVNASGMIGGWCLGTILIVFGGWPLYVALLVFFVIGSGATKLGYRRKAADGLAQEEGGRRGFRHAFANVGVAAFISILLSMMESWNLLLFAAIAALATAAADTAGSEIGQLFGKRAFLPLSFRSVPRGTEGAVSIEGTSASLAASFAVAAIGVFAAFHSNIAYPSLHGVSFQRMSGPIVLIGLAGFIAAYIESIVGAWDRTRERTIPNEVMNWFNTLVGALLVVMYGLTFAA